MRLAGALLVALLALAGAPTAMAQDVVGPEPTHADPRAALPDSIVTRPVRQAELADPAPTTLATALGLPETWCGTETSTDQSVNRPTTPASHFKLVYAYAAGQPDRFAALADHLQGDVSLLSRFIAGQSGDRKTLRWDMGTSCGAQFADIQVVALPHTLADYDDVYTTRFNEVAADLATILGTATTARDTVVYLDGFYQSSNGIAGEGQQRTGDGAAATQHDLGRLTAVVYGPSTPPSGAYAWPAVMLHEMGHNLGAVQATAPNSSGAGHCTDEHDVMCYADGGGRPMTMPCPSIAGQIDETFDCGGDDYFNPTPAAGTYLATHWNIFNSAHLGTCTDLATACGLAAVPGDAIAPVNTTLAAPVAWRADDYSVVLDGTDDSGVDAYRWTVDGGAEQTSRTATVSGDGIHVLQTRVRDTVGNWSDWRVESVRIDATAPAAAHGCPAGWSSGPVTCAATGSDARSGVDHLEVTVGGAAQADRPGGASAVAVGAEGQTAVAVRSVDGVGRVSPWSAGTARVDLSPPVATLSCEQTSPGLHRCVATASDTGSGVARLRLVRNGALAGDLVAGSPFDVQGPAVVAARADDAVARSATSAALALAGAPAASGSPSATAPTLPALPATASTPSSSDGAGAPSSGPTSVPPSSPAHAAPSSTAVLGVPVVPTIAAPARSPRATGPLRAHGRTLASATIAVDAGVAVARLSARGLPRGDYKLQACVVGRRCYDRTSRMRHAGVPRAVAIKVPVAGGSSVMVTFTVFKRVGKGYRPQATASLSAG